MVHVAWRRYYGLAVEKCLLNHRTPTEVHMYPDRGTITLKLVSHDIKACFV